VIPRLGGVTLSVLLHAGLIALLLWSASPWPPPLFVDLDLVERADPAGTAAAASPAEPARPRARIGAPAPGSTPVAPPPLAARAAAATPSPPPAAPITPVVPPAAPMPSEPIAEAGPAPAPAAVPVPAPAAAPSGPPSPPAMLHTAGGASGADAPVVAGAGVRGDTGAGPGGPPGSPLALALPGAGGPGAVPAEYGPYLRRFRQRVLESLVYPLAARRQGLGGTVELHVWLEPTGRVRDVQVARSSSHPLLDEAAVEAIRRLGPVPFPDSLPRRPLLIRVPLVFELR
jgi:periplasmic protein TonB